MTNREKIAEVFGLKQVASTCSCTKEEVKEICLQSGKCLICKKWLDQEYQEHTKDKE